MCRTADGKYKFNFIEMICSGRTGETSATGFCGVITSLICMICMIALIVFYFINKGEAGHVLEFMDKVIAMFGIGAALLGARKISGAIASTKNANIVDIVDKAIEEREKSRDSDQKN